MLRGMDVEGTNLGRELMV